MGRRLALPLAGGSTAFTLVRLLEGERRDIVPIAEIPPEFADAVARVAGAPPAWAGFSHVRPLVMGILNVTPDSFSDGGRTLDSKSALEAGRRMLAAGADIIDVGGESTRPGASEVPSAVEQDRVLPVIGALAGEGATLSIDTRHAATALAAVRLGAAIINDVSGFSFDPEFGAVLPDCPAALVAMHMRGNPPTMQDHCQYGDVAVDVARELDAAVRRLPVGRERVAADPGIGFAKGIGHNEALLARLPVLLNLGCRIVVGVSRKGFIGRISGETDPQARLPGSLAAGLAAVLGGAAVLRVHDVGATMQSLRVWQAIGDAG